MRGADFKSVGGLSPQLFDSAFVASLPLSAAYVKLRLASLTPIIHAVVSSIFSLYPSLPVYASKARFFVSRQESIFERNDELIRFSSNFRVVS